MVSGGLRGAKANFTNSPIHHLPTSGKTMSNSRGNFTICNLRGNFMQPGLTATSHGGVASSSVSSPITLMVSGPQTATMILSPLAILNFKWSIHLSSVRKKSTSAGSSARCRHVNLGSTLPMANMVAEDNRTGAKVNKRARINIIPFMTTTDSY